MRTRLIYLFIMLCGLFPTQQVKAQNQTLVLWHSDGSISEVELYVQPHVEITQDKLKITSSVLNLEYEASEIIRFTYKGVGNDIHSPLRTTNYTIEKDRIVFHEAGLGDKVELYKIDGIRIPVHANCDESGKTTLSLTEVPKGIYLMSVKGKTTKIMRR